MRETKNIEFKEKITNTFLKTVSAYANYGTGRIEFGINDNGKIVGIKDPKDKCLDIENKINDSIKPNPEYTLSIDEKTNVIILTVCKGKNTPYLYKAKAYKRNDSSSIEVDDVELKRLILRGENRSYDSLIAKNQDLSFKILEKALQNELGIEKLTSDILITLDLKKKDEGYTIAGELLADKNSSRGIDIIKFGENINIIQDREILDDISIINQYNLTVKKYNQYYQQEEIKGQNRILVDLIPQEAFREAIANALVHRNWDMNSQIKVSMYPDRIEVNSPGGLPSGLSKEEYLSGQLSVLRNPVIANVFFRLGLIEKFGTGIARIRESYEDSITQPKFEIFENSIKIVLPLLNYSPQFLDKDKSRIFDVLQGGTTSATLLAEKTGLSRTKILNLLKQMMADGYVVKYGQGRATKYGLTKNEI
ncbi:ATP-binding protein [Lactobacillus agrestimuris]|uniref:ATP-binding protein n=1 Tax=Lactobacillus agrestimuris TaxID=2941328 RepID=UPI002043396C|nr:ATP-binding protein [Lactobacillus agrestimuris]